MNHYLGEKIELLIYQYSNATIIEGILMILALTKFFICFISFHFRFDFTKFICYFIKKFIVFVIV